MKQDLLRIHLPRKNSSPILHIWTLVSILRFVIWIKPTGSTMLRPIIAGISFFLFLLLFSPPIFSQEYPQLKIPIDGQQGRDYFIIHYPDLDTSVGILDPYCGTKTYDGHLGIDFALPSFRQMDSGVTVRAAHEGIVIKAVDGLFDRYMVDTAEGYGNHLIILHPSGLASVYAHLKCNSLRVGFGDRVQAGQPIAQVGSSGRSSDPHLHLELWHIDTYWWINTLIQPFAAPCDTAENLWETPPAYDTTLAVLGSGLLNFLPGLVQLKTHPESPDFFTPADTLICFWIHLHGLRQSDILRLDWITPLGTLWFSYTDTVTRDWWYFYWWSYIFFPSPLIEGDWQVQFYRNDQRIFERTFRIRKKAVSTVPPKQFFTTSSVKITVTQTETILHFNNSPLTGLQYQLYDLYGREHARGIAHGATIVIPQRLPAGFYLIKVAETIFPIHFVPE